MYFLCDQNNCIIIMRGMNNYTCKNIPVQVGFQYRWFFQNQVPSCNSLLHQPKHWYSFWMYFGMVQFRVPMLIRNIFVAIQMQTYLMSLFCMEGRCYSLNILQSRLIFVLLLICTFKQRSYSFFCVHKVKLILLCMHKQSCLNYSILAHLYVCL